MTKPDRQRDTPLTVAERQHTLLAALGDTHTYLPDGIPDPNGNDRCDHPRCGLPLAHPIHTPEANR